MPPIRNEPMFAAPPKPELTLSKALAQYKIKDEKGSFTAYKVKGRVSCWECVNVLHEAGGQGEPPRAATIARTGGSVEAIDPQTGRTYLNSRILLCTGHGALWRRLDGIGEKPKTAARRR